MPDVIEQSYSYTRTAQPRNYESVSVTVAEKISVKSGEDPEKTYNDLRNRVITRAEVDLAHMVNQIRGVRSAAT